MKYKQLTDRLKAQIEILLESGCSTREVGRRLNISHSTVSRYKNNIYKKRELSIDHKYKDFISYLNKYYDRRNKSIEICVHQFKKSNPNKPYVSVQQVYNWINEGKINIRPKDMCYKRRKRRTRKTSMMNHVFWNIENKTVLPISL